MWPGGSSYQRQAWLRHTVRATAHLRLSPLRRRRAYREDLRSGRPQDQTTTETVYRHQIRPVVLGGAEAMDRIFPEG
jgi:hypothetical protein